MLLGILIGFAIGFTLNWVFIHFSLRSIPAFLDSIEDKYSRLLAIVQEWQKKI